MISSEKTMLLLAIGLLCLIFSCQENSLTQHNNPPNDQEQLTKKSSQTAQDSSTLQKADNRYIAMFKEQPPGIANAQAAQQAVEQTNAVLRSLHIKQDSLLHYYKWASQGFAGKFSKKQVEKLRQHPLIDHVAKDYYYKAIQTTTGKKSKITSPSAKPSIASSEITPWGVNRVGGPLNGTGKTAWVLDSGVDLDHPDLNP